jgi:hypothetical protein
MRLFTRHTSDDRLDPEMLMLFESKSRLPEFDERTRMRARATVANRLIQDGPSRGGLFPRFALAGLGIGGLWASLAGAATAHKAAAAVAGVSLVLGGAVAVEASGAGESVRESFGISRPQAEQQGQPDGAVAALEDQEVGPPDDSAPIDAERGDADTPGNLVAQLRDDGSFTMRAILVDVDGDSVTIGIAGASSYTLTLDADALVQVPGPGGEGAATVLGDRSLADYVGHLVFAAGTCDEPAAGIGDGCTITQLQVHGYAGQDVPRPAAPGQPELPSQADGAGQPEGAGQGAQPTDLGGQPSETPEAPDVPVGANDVPPVRTPEAPAGGRP